MALPALHIGRSRPAATAGSACTLGAVADAQGVNFAVFSAHADKVEVCLFSEDGARETARLPLPERDASIFHGHVAGIGPGTRYGLRAHGPYAPEAGHRFNPHKLLLDPYARQFDRRLGFHDLMLGYTAGGARADLGFDTRDSAPVMAKAIIQPALTPLHGPRPPAIPAEKALIYEAHARGLTMQHPEIPAGTRGTFAALASDPMLDHLQRLGVTAIELLPVQAFFDDHHLVSRGLANYWGYQTLGFFAPEPRYMGADGIAGFRAMVARFHAAGIAVILDVVYNHSGEGDHLGPTISFRGLDNRSYYWLTGGGRYYANHTGTGNTLNLSHPMVLRMVMDSLRHWVTVMGVDGFRFDLATVLGRESGGFDPGAGLLDAIGQDPVLSGVRLIAEPWDIGPGGYRLGQFPHPFSEWNDRFRDGVRRFWRGDAGFTPDLARRLLGSAEIFDRDGRRPGTSVNFITSHDGFTLADVVSYRDRHNQANGEDNRDGHAENLSDNFGTEGPSTDAAVIAARDRRRRNLIATLFLSQGTPMILAGDEVGNSQQGNNNAYAQDNATGWVNWDRPDAAMLGFITRLSALRRDLPVLAQRDFLHSALRDSDGLPDLEWRRADGAAPSDGDWHDTGFRTLCVLIRGCALRDTAETEVFAVFNAGAATALRLPDGVWLRVLDTANPDAPALAQSGLVPCDGGSVLAFRRDPTPTPEGE